MLQWDARDTYKNINLKLHPPAAKAWQVSRHTPTLVWSLTLSMMLFSSGNVPPTVLPWPLMFSNTNHTEGQNVKEGTTSATPPPQRCQLQRLTLCRGDSPALVYSWETARGLIFYQCLSVCAGIPLQRVCHTSCILGMWVKWSVLWITYDKPLPSIILIHKIIWRLSIIWAEGMHFILFVGLKYWSFWTGSKYIE